MTSRLHALRSVPNAVLLQGLAKLVERGRDDIAEIVAHLAEVERRRLHLEVGCSSLYVYGVRKLGLSEQSAFKRMRAARVARRYPEVLDMIADGRLHLSAIVCLYRKLIQGHRELLELSAGRTRRQVELLLAERFPQADVPTRITAMATATPPAPVPLLDEPEMSGKCPELSPGTVGLPLDSCAAPVLAGRVAPRAIVLPTHLRPLAPERFVLQVTISKGAHDLLRRAQELASGDVSELLERALTEFVAKLEKHKLAATEKPRAQRAQALGSRHIPAAVRREVRLRDEDQCTYVAPDGQRCQERRRLEFDHVVPMARGGGSTVANVRLLCRSHNQFAADRVFGEGYMERFRRAGP